MTWFIFHAATKNLFRIFEFVKQFIIFCNFGNTPFFVKIYDVLPSTVTANFKRVSEPDILCGPITASNPDVQGVG